MKNKFKSFKSNFLFSGVFSIKEENEKDSNDDDSSDFGNISKEESSSKEEKEENKSKDSNRKKESNEENNIIRNMIKARTFVRREKKDNIIINPVTVIIYQDKKKDSVLCRSNQTLHELIKYLNEKKYLSNYDKEKNDFIILYGLEKLKIDDKRKIYEIISDKKSNKPYEKENQIRIIIKNKDKNCVKDKILDKIYVSLENIPSFMDLSEQINIFINKYKKEEIKYDIKYKNNCCNITFLSSEISFSFVTYMTNLKFSNKYYRNLRIKLKYNNANYPKNNHLSNNSIIQNERNNSLLNSINNKNLKINIKKSYDKKNAGRHKSESYEHISVNTEPNQINDYFNDKYNFINESIPYEQEKILNKLEKEKNKQKWITYKGFFNGVNKKSFNSFINPYKKKISLSNIINNKEKKILLNINSL